MKKHAIGSIKWAETFFVKVEIIILICLPTILSFSQLYTSFQMKFFDRSFLSIHTTDCFVIPGIVVAISCCCSRSFQTYKIIFPFLLSCAALIDAFGTPLNRYHWRCWTIHNTIWIWQQLIQLEKRSGNQNTI